MISGRYSDTQYWKTAWQGSPQAETVLHNFDLAVSPSSVRAWMPHGMCWQVGKFYFTLRVGYLRNWP